VVVASVPVCSVVGTLGETVGWTTVELAGMLVLMMLTLLELLVIVELEEGVEEG